MKPIQFKTLQARLTVLLITPVVMILLVAGTVGFIYARRAMLDQWKQSVAYQLEQAAEAIERRLSKPLELMDMFSKSGAGETDVALLEAIIKKLKTLPSVVRVNLKWHGPVSGNRRGMGRDMEMGMGRDTEMGMGRFMPFHRGTFANISPPIVDKATGGQTVSLTMVLLDAEDVPVGNLEIVLKFENLVSDIAANVWWQNTRACIADRATGDMVLTSGLMQGRTRLGENGDKLELSVKKMIAEKSAGTLRGPGMPPRQVAGFHTLNTFPWSLVVFADGRTILAPIIRFRNGFIIGALVLIGAVYAVIRLNVDRMSAIIRNLSRRAGSVAAGNYNEKITVRSKDEIGLLATSFNAMIDGLKERDTIRNTFGRYVDPDFARALLNHPEAGRLGGRRQAVVILMADIRGFTPMAENMSPEETIDVLNRYFSSIIPLIRDHQGIIVDFVGDGILAFFDPIQDTLETTAGHCVRCAFAMQEALQRLNGHMADHGLPPLEVGIGINTGPVVVGNIGSEQRKKYGIVGAAVNATQRIQSQSEAGEVVATQAVVDMVRSHVVIQRDFSANLKGVALDVRLYALRPATKSPA